MSQRTSTLRKPWMGSNPSREDGRCFARLGLALGLAVSLCFGIIPLGWAQQTGEFEWLLQFGVATNDFSWDVHADGNGNVYVVGDTSGALPNQIFAGGALDAFVRKYDANGIELWTRQYGTTGNDRNAAVFSYGADLYVGWLTTGAFPGHVNLGGADAYLRKYDTNGQELWTRQFGTPGLDEVIGIFVHATGVYVSGTVDGILPGQTRVGGVDLFVRKFDFNGNELWTRQYGTTGRDVAFRISGDDSGVYVVGGTAGALPGQTHGGGTAPDAFVRKYDHDGVELWTRQFGTPAIDLAIGVTADASGPYVVGRADQALVGQSHAGGADVFVRRYGADGNELWTRQFGTTIFDLARGVAVRDSVLYISGVIGGAGPGFPGGQVGADVFVRAYTPKGKILWTRQFGSELADDNWAISAASSGVYVIGSATGTLPGLVSQGGIDAFVGKVVSEIVAEVDIKPGSDQNSIKLGPGIVPVAILTSDTFDATTVDPATVLLEGAPVRLTGNGTPMASAEDVNGDGLEDLLVHVEKAELSLTENDDTAELTGLTFQGRIVFGFDSVRILP